MARDFRRPERRQAFLLPPDMRDWLPQDDIVHLVLDAVSLMDLSKYEERHRVGGVGQAPFAPEMPLSLLIYAYSHGVKSSRAIERLCRRDAGYRYIVSEHVPDHTLIRRNPSRLPGVAGWAGPVAPEDAALAQAHLRLMDAAPGG
jgi:transposase